MLLLHNYFFYEIKSDFDNVNPKKSNTKEAFDTI
jgi:hypothetical protein